MGSQKKRADAYERENQELQADLEKAETAREEEEARAMKVEQDANRRVNEAKKEADKKVAEALRKVAEALRNADEAREHSECLQNQVKYLTCQLNGQSGPKARRAISNDRGFIEDDGDHSDDSDYEPASDSSSEEARVEKNSCSCEHGFNRKVCGNKDASQKTTFWLADLEKLCPDCREILKH